MTHSITIKVPERIFRPLSEKARSEGRKLEDVALESLSQNILGDIDKFESFADELAVYFDEQILDNAAPLSDLAVSRTGIYSEHL